MTETLTVAPSKVQRTSPKQSKIEFVHSHCPKNEKAFKVIVHHLWDHYFRVNYWGYNELLGNTIIDSLFLAIEEANGEWKVVDKTRR